MDDVEKDVTRMIKLGYLKHHYKTIATMNEKGEYEIIPSNSCKVGDVVWILEGESFVRTRIF